MKTVTPGAVSSCVFPLVEEDVAEISKPYRFPRLAKILGCGFKDGTRVAASRTFERTD
ncbi:hypothetical protein ACI2J4_16675 [Agrobacterium tumefaciens]|uniref:hypothetical protein n=1 Tax=Agrobacterium tumefaciens TaxID=358 RepID=UPI0038516D89